MTVEDVHPPENTTMANHSRPSQVRRAVIYSVKKARKEERLACGLYSALGVLESDPDNVFACIVPQSSDAGQHIHAVLLEAFCYENKIHFLKVNGLHYMKHILDDTNMDCSCLLIKKSANESKSYSSGAEKELIRFCSQALVSFPQPIISLVGT